MSSDKPKAVVDTNLVISGVLSRGGTPFRLLRAWSRGEFVGLLSDELWQEYAAVLTRPSVMSQFRLSADEIAEIKNAIDSNSVPVDLPQQYGFGLRDPKDEMVLATAIAGHAKYLVTGDRDLLEYSGDNLPGSLHIVTATQFLDELDVPNL